MKLVTFNIRCDFDQDGENSFRFRKGLILKKLEEEKPDVICFQEVLPHVAVWLRENLKDYYVVGCGRSEELRDEQVSVAFRKEKLNLISMETFWLSPSPYEPASRYPAQSTCPRVCTEVLLEDLEEQKVFRLFNLHLDHMGVEARRLGLTQILKKAKEAVLFPGAQVILAGDFNAEQDGEEMRILEEDISYINATKGIGITYHGFKPEDPPESIDDIFYQRPLKCRGVHKWEDREGNVWLSDHYPVCAELEWEM